MTSATMVRAIALASGGFGIALLVNAARADSCAPFAAIAAGSYQSCSMTASGAVACWGDDEYGEVGNGTTTGSASPFTAPVAVSGLTSGVTAIAAGNYFNCAVTLSGAAVCWGQNSGKLGNGSTLDSDVPVTVSGLSSVVGVATGDSHACAFTRSGAVYCWGNNQYGGLGNGTNTSSTTPVAVIGLSGSVVALTAGIQDTCALIRGGSVQCWGNNPYGGLGNGTRTSSNVPVSVSGLSSSVVSISAGDYHVCAVESGGAVVCWGYNGWGQLGNGTNQDSTVPVAVQQGLSRVVAVGAGVNHSCAVLQGGAVQCWGEGDHGELGDGSSTTSRLPVAVSALTSGAVNVSAGRFYSCAIAGGGVAQCWGSNADGQLGNGAKANSNVPTIVASGNCPATDNGTDAPLPLWSLIALGLALCAFARYRVREH